MLNRSKIVINVNSFYPRVAVVKSLLDDRPHCWWRVYNTTRGAPRRFQMVTSRRCHKYANSKRRVGQRGRGWLYKRMIAVIPVKTTVNSAADAHDSYARSPPPQVNVATMGVDNAVRVSFASR
jgi:hypothetical protein